MELLFKNKSIGIFLFVFLFFHVAKGQDGPFGIGNATGANGQPKLLLWLDGSTVSSPVNSDVLLWQDKSGNGNDFTAVAATSPILRSGGPEGENYLEFSKADNRMVSSNPITFSSSGVTIYYIFRTSDSDYSLFSFAESDANPHQILTREVSGVNSFTINGNQHNTNQGDLSNGSWKHAGFIWDSNDNSSNPTYWHRTNGSNPELTQTGVLSGETSAATGTVVIGHVQNLLNGGYISGEEFDGDLAEIIVYDGKLNKSMLRMMNTYIRTKYQISATGGWDKLTTPSAAYREAPIGIGRDGGSNSEHLHSSRDGLIIKANPGALTGSYEYLCAAHDAGSNSIVTTDVTGAVEARWSRIWFMRENPLNGNTQVQIAFDFGDGIGGEFPNIPENYELLYRSGNSGNFSPRPFIEKSILDDQIVIRVDGNDLPSNGYFTLGTTDNVNSSLDGQIIRTWYAYQSGNWSNPATWTLDGSSAPYYVNPNSEIPAIGDAIVIGSGRTVLMDMDNRIQTKLHISGGLDVASTSGHNFNEIYGNGLIRCAGSGGLGNFPQGTTTSFANPNSGGRVEFYGSGFTQSLDLELNKVRLNLNSASTEIVWAADLTHNGIFEIEKGVFRVNDGSSTLRTITSNNDVIVSSTGRIRPSTTTGTNKKHTWNFEADLINNGGDIRFTNRTAAAYTSGESQHWVEARFISATDNQSLIANGTTNLSRVVINKGNDDNYILTISSTNSNLFKLLGYCADNLGETSYSSETANSNSCALINGTLEVRENIFIPLHAGTSNYCINETAALWVNGGTVSKGAPDVGTSNTQAIVLYGKLKVSEGTLNAFCTSGLTTRDNGVLQVDGGTVNANQIRTSVLGSDNIGGVVINGGLVNVDGTLAGGLNGSYYTFSLTYPGNIFKMTGGELRVAGPSGRGLIFINSDPELTSVSGGTIIAEVKNTNNTHRISTRAPLWNLEIERTNSSATNRPVVITGGTSDDQVISHQALYIKNNLIIKGANAATLRSYSTSNSNIDIHIQGGFTIQNGGIYEHHENTTVFDGNANSLLSLPTSSTQTFHNVRIEKTVESRFAKIQSGYSTLAMEVQGDFELLSGTFNNGTRHVSLLGDAVINREFGDEAATGKAIFQGGSAQTINSSNGVFHNLEINNTNGVTLDNDGLTIRGQLRHIAGNFYLQNNKLRLEGENSSLYASSPGASKCLVTDGSASAGGLEVYFDALASMWYPLGVDDGGTVKYTPAYLAMNSGLVDDGYVQITPVDELLSTVYLAGGPDYVDFYWKVNHSDFDNVPMVSHIFAYDNADIVGAETEFCAGRVLTDNPFSREIDSLSVYNDHVRISDNRIYFNGLMDHGTQYTGTGRTLVNANYTAGSKDRFTGRPKVYFSRSSAYEADWNNSNNWNELSLFGSSDGPYEYHSSSVGPSTGYPETGDIAVIGFNPDNGKPHVYKAASGGITATQITFTPLQDASGNLLPRYYGSAPADITVLRPTLVVSNSSEISTVGQIVGEGAILINGDVDLKVTDVGDFLTQDSSIVILQAWQGISTFTSIPNYVPNLFVTSNFNGSNNFFATIENDVTVNGDLEIAGDADLFLATVARGDIKVNGDLKLGDYQASSPGPRLLFANSGNPRKIEVQGDVFVTGTGANIAVNSPNATSPTQYHNLVVWGNIYQNASGSGSTGLKFYTSPNTDDITLTLRGTGNHSFVNDDGSAPYLGKLIMDKGIDVSSSFTFNSEVNIDSPGLLSGKAVDLQNGLLVFNHPDINVTLANSGGAFLIPATAGLQLDEGALTLRGLNTGLLLDGILSVNGGDFYLGDTPGENNYLEYTANGTSTIELTAGNIHVGSQLRRGLTNTEGDLTYFQSGGTIRLGIYDAPELNRGVFEILDDGSFEFTGGTIQFTRGVNSTSTPSLLLTPGVSNVSGSGLIQIGDANSPSGGQIWNFGIQSSIAIPNLHIDNSSTNDPVVKLYVLPLTVSNLTEIDENAEIDCRHLDFTTGGDIHNDGVLTADDGTLFINHNTIGTLDGDGVYHLNNLSRISSGNTTVGADLVVNGNFFLEGGAMDFDTKQITVLGDANVNGSLFFDFGSEGLLMAGDASQILRRANSGTTSIDILSTDNPSGIRMISSAGYTFTIGKELRMKRGIFDLKGNLLRIGASGDIIQVNAFGESNMISTGGAFTNFGVEKTVPANSTSDVFMPIGLDKYMPVRLIFSDVGHSSGSTVSTYQFRLSIPYHSVISEIPNAPDPEVVDVNNVLQMWHNLTATGIGSGLVMSAEFSYHDDYVKTAGPYTESDYIGARVVDNSPVPDVFKFSSAVDPTNNIISIPFSNVTDEGVSGDYFAGVETSIPDNVPIFRTTHDGNVDDGGSTGVYDSAVPGGGAPNGAVVEIRNDDVLDFNVNGVNLYKTIIHEDAVLNVDGTNFHRIGIVEGTGTIRLTNVGTLPAGVYNEFFTCFGGQLEFAGTSNYDVLANIPIVRTVRMTGSGQRNLANNDVQVCTDLLIDGPDFRNVNGVKLIVDNDIDIDSGSLQNIQGDLQVGGNLNVNGGTFSATNTGLKRLHGDLNLNSGTVDLGSGGECEIYGDLNKTSGVFDGGSNTATLRFNGPALQHINGDLTATSFVNILEIDNTSGLDLSSNVDVKTSLVLSSGKIYTHSSSLVNLDGNNVTVSPVGGSSSSYIDGPMNWTLSSAGATTSQYRVFPVGKNERFRPLRIAERSAARTWTVEYFDTLAIVEPVVTSMNPTDEEYVETVSIQEYWRVNSNTASSTTAKVGLSWGEHSAVSPNPSDYQLLVSLVYNESTDTWDSQGGAGFNSADGGASGSFLSQNSTSFTERIFTLGSQLSVNPLPVTWLKFEGETDGLNHTLTWSTASEMNNSHFVLERSVDTENWSEIGQIEGAGNSTEQLHYLFKDRMAPQGRSYYRLKQVDFDGQIDYCPQIVSLSRSQNTDFGRDDIRLFPNPNNGNEVRVIVPAIQDEKVQFSISDLKGRVLEQSYVQINNQGISDPIQCQFPSGLYIVSVYNENGVWAAKLIINP